MVKVENLSLSIENINILKNISLSLNKSNILILLGENGSGKSMLLKTISGHYKNYTGDIYLDNNNLKKLKDIDRAKIISYVSSDFNSAFAYSVYEIVAMGRFVVNGESYSLKSKDKEIIKYAMDKTDIWSIRNKNIQNISTGERMRSFIARSLTTEANILLLDEPSASLDVRHKAMLYSLVRELVDNNKTIIMSLHDLNDAISLNKDVVLIRDGEVIASGNSKKILDSELIEKGYGVQSRKEECYVFF